MQQATATVDMHNRGNLTVTATIPDNFAKCAVLIEQNKDNVLLKETAISYK